MPKLAEGKTKVTFVTDEDIKDYLREWSKKKRWSMSQLVAVLIEEVVEKERSKQEPA